MIKLIASDLDGSLLDDKKRLPSAFFPLLARLRQCGILFVAASGRSHHTLLRNFEPHSDWLDYICDNGAYIVENGKPVSVEIIPPDCVRRLILATEGMEQVRLILCGRHGMYHHSYDDRFASEINSFYLNHIITDNLLAVEDDIFKVAICDLRNPATGTFQTLESLFGQELALQLSGPMWMDAMNPGVNKGAALEKIQRKRGIFPEETMAFGDYYNDIELLARAKYSFVMANAREDIFQYGAYRCKSNNESGVLKAIEEYVFQMPL